MRKRIVAGNWKMNTNLQEGIQLAKKINEFLIDFDITNKSIVLGTPFTHIFPVVSIVDYTKISIAAQNCAAWEKGAYTGEVSAEMIASTGARYIIIGHSERRQYFKEESETLLKKVKLCIKHELVPIFCCGEVLNERETDIHFNVVKQQLMESILTLSENDFSKVVIAYEPVWAIGTGKTATAAQAQEMHMFIRKCIAEKFGISNAIETSVIYGGSCNPANATELFSQTDVDGGLNGGASLKAEDFIEIIKVI
jgi:triosephosphate isomerase (TIM)